MMMIDEVSRVSIVDRINIEDTNQDGIGVWKGEVNIVDRVNAGMPSEGKGGEKLVSLSSLRKDVLRPTCAVNGGIEDHVEAIRRNRGQPRI
jgi:hypothetical protein